MKPCITFSTDKFNFHVILVSVYVMAEPAEIFYFWV